MLASSGRRVVTALISSHELGVISEKAQPRERSASTTTRVRQQDGGLVECSQPSHGNREASGAISVLGPVDGGNVVNRRFKAQFISEARWSTGHLISHGGEGIRHAKTGEPELPWSPTPGQRVCRVRVPLLSW